MLIRGKGAGRSHFGVLCYRDPVCPTDEEAARYPGGSNVGCAHDVKPGWVNVDAKDFGAEMAWDLDRTLWPWRDDHFDYIYAANILEQLADFNRTVWETWRVTKPGATVFVVAPFFPSTRYYSGPTHRNPCGIRSFEGFEVLRPGQGFKWYDGWRRAHGVPSRGFCVAKRFVFSNHPALRWINPLLNIEPYRPGQSLHHQPGQRGGSNRKSRAFRTSQPACLPEPETARSRSASGSRTRFDSARVSNGRSHTIRIAMRNHAKTIRASRIQADRSLRTVACADHHPGWRRDCSNLSAATNHA